MDSMDIAALSMSMSSTKLQMSAGISVAKKSMDQAEVNAQGLLQMLPDVTGTLGNIIDVSA